MIDNYDILLKSKYFSIYLIFDNIFNNNNEILNKYIFIADDKLYIVLCFLSNKFKKRVIF